MNKHFNKKKSYWHFVTWTEVSNPVAGTAVRPAWWQVTLSFPPFHLQMQCFRHWVDPAGVRGVVAAVVITLADPTSAAK